MQKKFRIGFLLYPGLTQLDLTGPAQILGRMPNTSLYFVARTRAPIVDEAGLTILPTHEIDSCPSLDMICVPGGYGCIEVIQDSEVLGWLKSQAQSAQFVTSVCTGSLILGAAKLLHGKKAACHWAWRDLLSEFGAAPVSSRIVEDGNVITGGGVTAGIDFAFYIVEKLHGREFAEVLQLVLEYDPTPFARGTPSKARPIAVIAAKKLMDERGLAVGMAKIREITARKFG